MQYLKIKFVLLIYREIYMKLFSSRSTLHIAENIGLKKGACTIKNFNDGELFVRIDENVDKQTVWVMASTPAPAENLFELFFLCDALKRAGAHLNVCITYLAYARQIVASPGEAWTAYVIADFIKRFSINKLYIIHPHSKALHNLLPFEAIRDTNFFCTQAEEFDAIAAPDKGASQFAEEVARLCNKDLVLLSKKRPEKERVEITAIQGAVDHKKILLIDDIISTARTITESAHALKSLGAYSVSAAATHGVFSPGAYELLEQSPLEKIFVTNTIANKSQGKITVVDTSAFIQKIMQEK